MKKVFASLSLLLALSLSAHAQERCNRVTDSKGEVSFCLPKGWVTAGYDSKVDIKVWETPILDMSPLILSLIRMAAKNDDPDFAANYAKKRVANDNESPAVAEKLLSSSEVVTNSGLKGIRLVFTGQTRHKTDMRTVTFIIDLPDGKALLEIVGLESDSKRVESQGSKLMKTLRINVGSAGVKDQGIQNP